MAMTMANSSNKAREDEREGAEIVHGPEACFDQSTRLVEELGFPKEIFPLKDLEECGRVHETGFVWMKQKAPTEHFFEGTNTLVSYAKEVTAYLGKNRMKKICGVKCKQLLVWVPVVELISFDHPEGRKIQFKTQLGIRKTYSAAVFVSVEEKQRLFEKQNRE